MKKVLITQAKWDIPRYFGGTLPGLQDAAEIILNQKDAPMSAADVQEAADGVEVIVTGWGGCPIKPEILDAAKKLRLIAVLGGTIRPHSPEPALQRGIRFCNCPSAVGRYVAEFAMGLILSMCYEIPWHDQLIKKQKTDKIPGGAYYNRNGWLAKGLNRSLVGIVGSGNIARHMLDFLKPYNCSILMYDPYLSDKDASLSGVEKVDLETLMRRSEIVTIHAGWTKETTGLVSRRHLALLRNGAIVVNTARMPILDEAALLEEVKSGRLRACLNLIPFNPIWYDKEIEDSRNIFLSCGSATVADKTLSDMGNMLAEDIIRFARGEKLMNEVTGDMLARMT